MYLSAERRPIASGRRTLGRESGRRHDRSTRRYRRRDRGCRSGARGQRPSGARLVGRRRRARPLVVVASAHGDSTRTDRIDRERSLARRTTSGGTPARAGGRRARARSSRDRPGSSTSRPPVAGDGVVSFADIVGPMASDNVRRRRSARSLSRPRRAGGCGRARWSAGACGSACGSTNPNLRPNDGSVRGASSCSLRTVMSRAWSSRCNTCGTGAPRSVRR